MAELSGKRIVIAGGSGFLGISMAESFSAAGAEVAILSRSAPLVTGSWTHEVWDARSLGSWVDLLAGADAVVNLTGRTVNCIKTPDHQDEILRSRVESTRVLGEAMRAVDSPPPTWVQMSTAHIYGDPPTLVCNEDSAEGIGFAPTIARAWECAFEESKLPNDHKHAQRGVVMRTSFVVGRDRGGGGGALATLRLIAKLGLGGRAGKGLQGMSWIHEDDLNAIIARAIVDDLMTGAYIVSSPNPMSQVDFMRTLRKVIGMPIGLPATEWMVRIGAPLFLRTDPELVLYGRYVLPKRLMDEGFEFQFAELEPALRDLCDRRD
ncbi:epimerase [Novipirellula artificiosorum]|uniref:Epimerase family protein n=1 Tax=Novipirellula artificiosorum TaxID=2528016 RepID=A0A5C6DSV8_9BACT|nr:DUF1731 domain-containing protein [Novipirellula artificiosorum]TWU39385.1 Epimerase family protein [Novipirellula artificiosorum]